MQGIGSEMMNWLGVSSKALNFYAEFPAARGVIRFFHFCLSEYLSSPEESWEIIL